MRHWAVTGSRGLPDLLRFRHFCCPASFLSPSQPGLTGCLFPQLLIKLKTQTSTEYFLEACSREERDAWAFEITGAIHAGQPGKVQQLHLLKNSFKLPPHISLQRVPSAALALPGFAAASAVCLAQGGDLCGCYIGLAGAATVLQGLLTLFSLCGSGPASLLW